MKEKIKFVAWMIACAVFVFKPITASAEAEEKKVCTTQVDPKTKKEKEVCKTIKVHKKVEGDKVPDKK
jgi:hypothetical protein